MLTYDDGGIHILKPGSVGREQYTTLPTSAGRMRTFRIVGSGHIHSRVVPPGPASAAKIARAGRGLGSKSLLAKNVPNNLKGSLILFGDCHLWPV